MVPVTHPGVERGNDPFFCYRRFHLCRHSGLSGRFAVDPRHRWWFL